MKESYENPISLISLVWILYQILEYIYTGPVKEESLTKDNAAVEAFYTADYFQLSDLQDLLWKFSWFVGWDDM